MDVHSEQCLHQFRHVLDWLGDWACSRRYGLGSRLPWDPEVVIESLSDSTVYMAYYTVKDLIHVRKYVHVCVGACVCVCVCDCAAAEIQTLCMSPIAPHMCEYIWTRVLGKAGDCGGGGGCDEGSCSDRPLAVNARWPGSDEIPPRDVLLSRKFALLRSSIERFRSNKLNLLKPKKGGAAKKKDPSQEETAAASTSATTGQWRPSSAPSAPRHHLPPAPRHHLPPAPRHPLPLSCPIAKQGIEALKAQPKTLKLAMPFASFLVKVSR
eukprot:GHVU01004544.1.p1 GENE.GHVU01004544.1~~GHVU01004544.1.p1  ORF type:complete len:267 (+),score=38.03 GHVU01004544.1:82-882(+)